MEYNPVGWFEIPVIDLQRAMKFYTDLFGYTLDLQPEKSGFTMAWFPMVDKMMGAAGTLILGEGYTPSHEGSMVYFSVPSVQETLTRVEGVGGKILMPKTDTGGHGFFAWVEDTEGNRIAIHSMQG